MLWFCESIYEIFEVSTFTHAGAATKCTFGILLRYRRRESCTERLKRSSSWSLIAHVQPKFFNRVEMANPWTPARVMQPCWATRPAERREWTASSAPFSKKETLSSSIWAAQTLLPKLLMLKMIQYSALPASNTSDPVCRLIPSPLISWIGCCWIREEVYRAMVLDTTWLPMDVVLKP